MQSLDFELVETGRGTTVLMLPGSFATPSAWKGIQSALSTPLRTLSTCLPGYGSTPEVRPHGDASIAHMIEFVGQVADAVEKPFHIAGHSWGAQLVFAALLEKRIEPLSFISFEGNPIFAQPRDAPFPWREEIERMVESFGTAIAASDPDAASIIIDFYSERGTFQGMPEGVREFCRATASTNLLDWYSAASFTPSFEDFAAIDLPVTLVRGGNTVAPIVDVTDQLGTTIPLAEEVVVEGAGHFLISTHPAACADILESHISQWDR